MIGETVSFSEMFDVVDEEAGNWYKDNTPTDARIATTSEGTHMRPVSYGKSVQLCFGLLCILGRFAVLCLARPV